ncbi:MAG: CZB domain-containing protein [Gammaproteobacteria bacterium]
MNKTEAQARLKAARSAHLQWRGRAQAIVAGVEIDESKIPVMHTDCQFGQWYYGEGQFLSTLPAYRAIEAPHAELHGKYKELFDALHAEDDRSALKKMFGGGDFDAEKKQNARDLLEELNTISVNLLGCIDDLEQAIDALTDEDCARLSGG